MADSPPVRVVPLPGGEPRVETSAVQFGNDWPGLFIRGDEAFGLAHDIDTLGRSHDSLPAASRRAEGWAVADALAGLRDLVRVVRDEVTVVTLPPRE